MSRIGKQPVFIPGGVVVSLEGRKISARGPKGSLARVLPNGVEVEVDKESVSVLPPSRPKQNTALQGLMRSLISNMVTGVSEGFEKKLDMEGVGYRAFQKGSSLELHVGFSNPVQFKLPNGITADVDGNNRITVSGIDKQQVGQVAADIRSIRPPEPYKGKGIRYVGEYIKRKVGKAVIK